MRKTAYPSYPRASELLAENPYTPPSTLAQAIMHASQLLAELVVVREWLHETAPQPASVDATTGYWKFTKHQVMQALRTNKALSLSGMDPDAPNREEGGNLAPDDAVSGLSLLCHHARPDMPERHTKKSLLTRCMHMYGRADSKRR